jgi:Uma2 family endonuclease
MLDVSAGGGAAMQVVESPYALEDYLAMPEDGCRYEVVDGQPVMVPAPVVAHQVVVSRVLRLLDDACPAGYLAVASPIDWVLWQAPQLQIRQPDVAVISAGQASGPRLTEAPLLIVEVLSPDSFERDLIAKRREYAAAGAQHYWVIDPLAPAIVVYQRRGEALVESDRAVGATELRCAEPFPVRVRPDRLVWLPTGPPG